MVEQRVRARLGLFAREVYKSCDCYHYKCRNPDSWAVLSAVSRTRANRLLERIVGNYFRLWDLRVDLRCPGVAGKQWLFNI